MFQLSQRGGSLCRLCLLRTPSTTTKTFSSLIQKENKILSSFTPLSLSSSSLPSSPYSPLSSSLSYSRGLGGSSPLSSPLPSSVSSSSSSLLPPPSSFLPPSSPLSPSSFLPPASPSSSRLFSQSQNKLSKDDEDSDGDTLGGGVVPRSVNPIQEIRRLLSLPFKEEVLVFPIFEKPFVPMTTGQHVVPHSPFLEKLLELSSVKRDGRVGMFLVQDPDQNNQDAKITFKNIQKTGVLGGIVNIQPLSDVDATNRKYVLFLAGLRRVKIVGEGRHTGEDGLLSVKIEPISAFPYDKNDIKIRALVDALTNNIHELLRTEMNPLYRNHLESLVKQINPNDPAELADLAAAFSSPGRDELQEVIEELDIQKRLTLAVSLLKKELEVNRFQMQIQKQLEEKMSANHRKFLMTEQLKMLKKELGLEKDDKEALLTKYKERLEALNLPERAEQVANDEMNKLSTLEPSSSEYNVTRTYLDWLTTLPWGVYTEDNLDLTHAKSVLEDEHFGLDDIKDLILEFIAVGHLRGGVRGKIFCFVGPPGVGKTSIGKSIANALGRKFFRFSVGGLSDVAEIKGHRRTYVGAMPGKLVQAIKQVQSSNPVIMIDEIDKMQKGYQGDPASALLEVLDPEQNGSFLDHYLDVPYDFSKILFLCTANVIDTIPKPLQDRMEIVRLSGYVLEEKVQIAKQYLIPQTMEEMGLKKDQVSLHSNAVRQLINRYCRESGVRNLQKHIEKLLRKAAYKIVTDSQENDGKFTKVSVMEKNLVDYVGKPVFTSDRFYMKTPVGVTMGLSWTAMGGATLYIEVVVEPGSKGEVMRTTGKMGDVMKESTEIAYTYAKTYLDYLLNTEENVNLRVGGPRKKKMRFPRADKEFFQKNMVHLHVPEGATPKDGPSAGVTMVTSLLSLALNRHVNPDVAMTGELTVSGKVLPIGGVKEKTIAAKRSKVTHVIFPIDNKKDYEELPDNITEGLTVHYAKYYHDVFDVAFGQKGKKKSVKGTVEEAEVETVEEAEVEEIVEVEVEE